MLDEPILSTGLEVEPLIEETFRFFAARDYPLAKILSCRKKIFTEKYFWLMKKGVSIELCLISLLRKKVLILLLI